MSATATESKPKIDIEKEYKELLNAVEYHCSLCEAVYEDIAVLNRKIEAVYQTVVDQTRTNRNHMALVKHWMAAYFVATEIQRAVCMKKEVHQICGIDSSTVDDVHAAIKERLEFLLGFKLNACD